MKTRRTTARRAAALVASAAAMSLFVAGCSPEAGGNNGNGDDLPSLTLRVGHGFTSTSVEHAELLEVAKRVGERTDGNLTLQIFSDSTLGSTAESVEQAVSGADVIAFIDASGAAVFGAPEMGVLSGPFLFATTEEAVEFQKTSLFEEWTDSLADNGLRVLAMNWLDQPRDIMGSAAYTSPEDMQGVKIRIPPLDAWLKTFQAVGAVAVEMATAEVFSGMEQGVIDAGESAPNAMFAFGWAEVAKHLTQTGHIRPVMGYGMSSTVFDSLPAEYQTILLEEFWAGGETVTANHAALTDETLETMKGMGVTIHEADHQAWQDAASGFYDDAAHPDWRPGLVDQVRSAVQ